MMNERARFRLHHPVSVGEAHLPTSDGHQVSVPELMAETGGYLRSSRHRHWLRQGYVEELYRRDA
jgi:hypothetical protein